MANSSGIFNIPVILFIFLHKILFFCIKSSFPFVFPFILACKIFSALKIPKLRPKKADE